MSKTYAVKWRRIGTDAAKKADPESFELMECIGLSLRDVVARAISATKNGKIEIHSVRPE